MAPIHTSKRLHAAQKPEVPTLLLCLTGLNGSGRDVSTARETMTRNERHNARTARIARGGL